ncbi:MAG: hypothetical protein ACI81T_004112 [Bacteroidia bacterium]|jgi:hypothetical protein
MRRKLAFSRVDSFSQEFVPPISKALSEDWEMVSPSKFETSFRAVGSLPTF